MSENEHVIAVWDMGLIALSLNVTEDTPMSVIETFCNKVCYGKMPFDVVSYRTKEGATIFVAEPVDQGYLEAPDPHKVISWEVYWYSPEKQVEYALPIFQGTIVSVMQLFQIAHLCQELGERLSYPK